MGGSPSRHDDHKKSKSRLHYVELKQQREMEGIQKFTESISTDSSILGRVNKSEEILTCTNCGRDFDINQNTEKSCRYHSGMMRQTGKEGPPKWSCCSKEDLELTATHKLNIAVVGGPGVGKTSLITRVVLSAWIEDIRNPSSTDTSMVSLLTQIYNFVSYTFEFTEIPEIPEIPQAGDHTLNEHNCAFVEASFILLVCAIDNLESLKKLSSYREKINNAKIKDGGFYPVVLVLNKTDLNDSRKIEAKDLEALDFSKCSVEFSAKTGDGCEHLVESILEQADHFHLFNNGCCTSKHVASSPRRTKRKL